MNLAVIKRVPTLFLRGIVLLLGVIVLIFCVFVLPQAWNGGTGEFPLADRAVLLIAIGMYTTTVPFFIGLWQTLQILSAIDRNAAFSNSSVRALTIIKWCAAMISMLYVAGIPLLYPIAQVEDAPGMIIMGAVVACAPITVAVFAAVLQKLLQSAIEIQAENDLTV